MKLPDSSLGAVITLHPAFVMRGMLQQMPDVRSAISRARLIAVAGRIDRPKFDLNLNPSVADLRDYIASAPTSHPVSIDIETPRHQPHKIDLVGVSVSPWSAMVAPGEPEFIDVVADVLADSSRMKIGHNFTYDLRAFLAAGAELSRLDAMMSGGYKADIGDTIQAEALLRPPFKEAKKRRWLALSTCVLRRFALPYWKEDASPATKALYSKWFPNVTGWNYRKLYCALDASLTWMLFQKQVQEIDDRGQHRIFFNIICPANAALVDMEDYGIPVDRELLKTRREQTAERIAEINASIADEVAGRHFTRRAMTEAQMTVLCAQRDAIVKIVKGKAKPDTRNPERKAFTPKIAKLRTKLKQIGDAFESGNDNHWRWLLFGDPSEGGLNLRPTRLTGKAALPGVDEDDIEELQRIYPAVTILSQRVELQHLYRRARWLKSLTPDSNGRVHIPWSLHRTENGRVASGFDDAEDDKPRESDGGQIMNVPEPDRPIFCAEPGMSWVAGDMSQVELRVMAWLARDLQLLAELRDGVDVHAQNAAAIFKCKPEDAETTMVRFEGAMRPARTACKRPTHGWDYGLMDEKCGRMFRPCEDMSLEAIIKFLAEEHRASSGMFGMNEASWNRRKRQAERSKMPEAEYSKLVRLVYDEANTLTARHWRLDYFARRKGLARFQGEVIASVEQNKRLVNPYSRILEFFNFRYNYKTMKKEIGDREEALAFLPASTVADEAKAMIPPMAQAAKKHGGRLLVFNHDEFSAQIPDENVPAYLVDARAIMEREWRALGQVEGFGWFSCPAGFAVGKNWGKADETNPNGLKKVKA